MKRSVSDSHLRLLRIFRTVVESGSFTAAAAQLNISDSTISSHMQDLETSLGVRLCERGRSGFRLTKNGRIIYDETLRLMQLLGTFQARVGSLTGSMTGSLEVGVADNMATHDESPFHEAVDRFVARKNNRVVLNLRSLNPREMEHGIMTGELHLAVGPKHQNVGGLRYEFLFNEPNHFYCGREHPFFALPDDSITRAQLSHAAIIGRGYISKFDYAFFGNVQHQANVYSMDAGIMLIRSGRFLGFLPDHCARPWIAKGEMRAIQPKELRFDARFHVITRKSVDLELSATSFIQDLRHAHQASSQSARAATSTSQPRARAR